MKQTVCMLQVDGFHCWDWLSMSWRTHDDRQSFVFLSLIQLQGATGLCSRKKWMNIVEGRLEVRIFIFFMKFCCDLNKNEGWQSLHCINASTNTHHFAISWVNQHSFLNSETKYCDNECYEPAVPSSLPQ